MITGTVTRSPEEIPLETQQAKYWIIAPSGRRIAVDRTETFTYEEEGVKCNGDPVIKTHYDTRPRVFCAQGQGESVENLFTPGHFRLASKYDTFSWRAVEGVNYIGNGFEITAHGKAYYDPNDPVQATAAKAYDRAQSCFSFIDWCRSCVSCCFPP